MKEISIFLHSLVAGGAERVAVNLANGFNDSGHDVDVVLAKGEGEFYTLLSENINIVDLNMPESKFGVLRCAPHLSRYLSKKDPDILISIENYNNIPAIISKTFASTSCKLIVTQHNDPRLARSEGSWRNQLVVKLSKYLYPLSDQVVAVSDGTRTGLSKTIGMPLQQIKRIYNPIVTTEMLKEAKEPVSHPWFRNESTPVVLSVGRLADRKDFDTLLKAHRKVVTNRGAKLVIIGKGEKKQEIIDRITTLGLEEDVELLGYVDNVYKYMAQASVFILSSTWEGFGNVLVEAMACGCPVIATDCPSGPSEILANGELGKLVPVRDTDALANAICQTLSKPDEPGVLVNRAEDFSIDNIIPEYEYLF